jgi:mannitol/fructose-specific phosphotransferase system IIA component (Ntr-type)
MQTLQLTGPWEWATAQYNKLKAEVKNLSPVQRVQQLLDKIINRDKQTVALAENLAAQFEVAVKNNVAIPKDKLEGFARITQSVAKRQDKIKNNKDVKVEKTVTLPPRVTSYLKTSAALNGLGIEPVTTTLIVVAAISAASALALYKYFEPDYKKAEADWSEMTQLDSFLKQALAEGKITPDQYHQMVKEVNDQTSQAYTQGGRDEWWESNKSWVKTLSLIAITAGAIIYGPDLIKKYSSKAA